MVLKRRNTNCSAVDSVEQVSALGQKPIFGGVNRMVVSD